MWTSALFYAKNSGFFEIYVVSAGKLQTRGEKIFCDFVRLSFMDGPNTIIFLRVINNSNLKHVSALIQFSFPG